MSSSIEAIKIKKAGNVITTKICGGKAPYIQYMGLENTGFVHNGFSTRIGGVSTGMYESMNFSVKMGDSAENVRRNFEIFLSENDFDNPVMTDQTHTVNVRRVTADDIGKNVFREADYREVDGFVTNERGITLITSYADCVPLYFVDVKNKAVGLSHSGWRGTVGRMGASTLNAMNREFGTRASDVFAAIGPSICVNCYEVSADVAENFQREFHVLPKNYEEISEAEREKLPQNMEHMLYKKSDGKYMLNLWVANYRVLCDAGVNPRNIFIPDICTCCNKGILFSHRGHMGKRGNMCAFLQIV